MWKSALLGYFSLVFFSGYAQRPCADALHRQFDFWLGDWEVFAQNDLKAGDSHVSLLLDSCVILEEWTSGNVARGIRYAGKSFNTYNAQSGQWQQTWVDNTGGTIEFLQGRRSGDTLSFMTMPFLLSKDSLATRRLRFIQLSPDLVRQWGELSKDEGLTWTTEYDLKYRRKPAVAAQLDSQLRKMEAAFAIADYQQIAAVYHPEAVIIGQGTTTVARKAILAYWQQLTAMGGSWTLTSTETQKMGDLYWQKGISRIIDASGQTHQVLFTLLWSRSEGSWKILQDAYW